MFNSASSAFRLSIPWNKGQQHLSSQSNEIHETNKELHPRKISSMVFHKYSFTSSASIMPLYCWRHSAKEPKIWTCCVWDIQSGTFVRSPVELRPTRTYKDEVGWTELQCNTINPGNSTICRRCDMAICKDRGKCRTCKRMKAGKKCLSD